MPSNGRTVKQAGTALPKGNYSAVKRNEQLILRTARMDLKGFIMSGKKKKPYSKGYILYDSIYITVSK